MQIIYLDAQIANICLHIVGNKIADGGLLFSIKPTKINDTLKSLLLHYFVNSFKSDEYFQLSHESDINLNEVYTYVSKIFDNPQTLYEQSINFAKHLYEQSNHPKIKGGEFYTVYFKDCILDGDTVDAVGLFKSENKDTFLKVLLQDGNFNLESEQGININKLDKGCLIFNKEREKGYVVAIVDNVNKGAEAQYWIDDFLHVRQRQDEYYNTQNVLSLCKNFVTKELPQQFEIAKADQLDLLNKSIKFFKEKENFDLQDFTHEVIEQPEVIKSFNHYKSRFEAERDIEIANQFSISDSAVKKQSRSFKSIIKLDKNFHIYVHGNRNLIEQGEDDKGKFYKVYYKEES